MILFGTDPPPGNGHFTGWPAGGTQSNQARSDAVRWRRGVRYLRRHPRRSGRHLVLHMAPSWGGLETRIPLLNGVLNWQIPTSPKLDQALRT